LEDKSGDSLEGQRQIDLRLDSPLVRLGAWWRGVVKDIGDSFFGSDIPLSPMQVRNSSCRSVHLVYSSDPLSSLSKIVLPKHESNLQSIALVLSLIDLGFPSACRGVVEDHR
jgi:hypothetical protein